MRLFRSAFIGCALAALPVSVPLAQDASLCEAPNFKLPASSPFALNPKPKKTGDPKALVAGDFFKRAEGGCGCDLAITLSIDGQEGFVALLRGNQDGTFAQRTVLPLPAGEIAVAIVKARFRVAGTSELDSVVVVTQLPDALDRPGRVRIFTPDERGTYSSPPTFWLADKVPIAMTVGDFNEDGNLDVAVISRTGNVLTVLTGDGHGGFAQPVHVNLGRNIPNALAAGRFSGGPGDSIAVATVSPDPEDAAARRVAMVLVRPDGRGSFTVDAPMMIGGKNSFMPWIAAANLTGPAGATSRPMRDLAIALVDRDASGNPVGMASVLLAKEGGGFTFGPLQVLGPVLPRSVTVADLDDDGVADLIVSAHASEPSIINGTIHFFQGKTGAQAGFHSNADWFTIPEKVGIRPSSVAVGRFGPKEMGPGGAKPAIGLAFTNALNLQSVAVFLRNGMGSFDEATVVTTRLPTDATSFLPGDFRSTDAAGRENDLAYVTPDPNGQKVLSFLVANGAGGFIKSDDMPSFAIGFGPHRIIKGQFDKSGPTDIVVLDTNRDAAAQVPFLKILFGRGGGRFTVSEVALRREDRPFAITAGRFSDQPEGAPLDLAVINSDGRITLLVNDGEGRFPAAKRRFTPLPLNPADIAFVDNLRGSGRFDLVVRDANADRFMLLINRGPVEPDDSQFKSGGFFGGAGGVPRLLIGEMPGNDTLKQLDHIVTFDSSSIRSFKPTGVDTYELLVNSLRGGDYAVALPFALADLGNGKPDVVVPVVKGESLGILQMKGDGAGGYTFLNVHVEPDIARGDPSRVVEKTDWLQAPPVPGVVFERKFIASLAAPFRASLHGGGKADAAFITSLARNEIRAGMCASDPQTQPATPPTRFVPPICSIIPPEADEACCTSFGKCSNCPKNEVCEPQPQPPPQPPFQAFCRVTQSFGPVITVFANTCGD